MSFTKTELQQIAMSLRKDNAQKDVALVHPTAGNTVYYSLHDPTRAHYPTSAIVEAIQALNQHGTEPYEAEVLRVKDGNRVFSTAEPNTMDREMAAMNRIQLEKLPAKPLPKDYELPGRGSFTLLASDRWTESSPLGAFAKTEGGPEPSVIFGGGEKDHTLDRLYMMAVFALVANRFVRDKDGNANIGALLVSQVGKILAWSVNTKEHNSTCHAEVNLLQGLFFHSPDTSLDRSRIYTTLKPCRMCAGMIAHVGGGKIQVLYGQGDPGPDAQNTKLDGTGKLHPLDGKSGGPKAVMAVLKKAVGETEKVKLLVELEAERERAKKSTAKEEKGPIAHTLSLPRSEELMRGAARALANKLDKYESGNGKKANVRRVLGHIEPFLTLNAAHPSQISGL